MRATLTALLGCIFALPQTEPIRVTVQLVQVSLIAHKRGGEPVTDLTKEDFEIFDNGSQQAIRLFAVEKQHTSSVVRASLPENTFSNRISYGVETVPGVTVVLFDVLNTGFVDQAYAKKQLISVLHQIQPGVLICVYVLAREITVLHDFTDNPSQLESVLARLEGRESREVAGAEVNLRERAGDFNVQRGQFSEGEKFLNGAERVAQDYFNVDRAMITLNAFEAIANHLATQPGRKTLVWISGSFPFTLGVSEKDFENFATDSPNRERGSFKVPFERTMRAINNADVAIYPVDARGLLPSTDYDAAGRFSEHGKENYRPANLDTMENLANKSGGRAFFNTNDLREAINTALEDGRVTYTLGFYPSSGFDDKFHTLKVQVHRSGVTLRYRLGYFARSQSPGDSESKTMLKRALSNPVDAAAIGLTVKLERSQTKNEGWRLITSVDSNDLGVDQQGEKWVGHLQIVYSVQTETGKELAGVLDNVNLDLKTEVWREIAAKGLPLRKEFSPPPDASKVRIAVLDLATGRTGSISVPLRRAE